MAKQFGTSLDNFTHPDFIAEKGAPLDAQRIGAYTPSPLERQSAGIADYLMEKGLISDNYRAREIGDSFSTLAEMLPGIGDVEGVAEGLHMGMQGDPMKGGIMAIASMAPFIKGSAFAKKWEDLQKKIADFRHDEARELRNVAYDRDPAFRSYSRIRGKRVKAQKEQLRLIDDAPAEQLGPIGGMPQSDIPIGPPPERLQDVIKDSAVRTNKALQKTEVRRIPTPRLPWEEQDTLTMLENLSIRPRRK